MSKWLVNSQNFMDLSFAQHILRHMGSYHQAMDVCQSSGLWHIHVSVYLPICAFLCRSVAQVTLEFSFPLDGYSKRLDYRLHISKMHADPRYLFLRGQLVKVGVTLPQTSTPGFQELLLSMMSVCLFDNPSLLIHS